MTRELGDYIADILNAAREVEEFTEGMDYEAFRADKKTVNAVIRSLEVIAILAENGFAELLQEPKDFLFARQRLACLVQCSGGLCRHRASRIVGSRSMPSLRSRTLAG